MVLHAVGVLDVVPPHRFGLLRGVAALCLVCPFARSAFFTLGSVLHLARTADNASAVLSVAITYRAFPFPLNGSARIAIYKRAATLSLTRVARHSTGGNASMFAPMR
jgi:hypothetical protein